jgi:hypothetical protein
MILTKGQQNGKVIRLRSAITKLRRDREEQITRSRVAINH